MRGGFVVADGRLDGVRAAPRRGQCAVLLAQEIELGALQFRRIGGGDIIHGCAFGANHRGLMVRGEKGAGKVLRAAVGHPVVVQQHVAGQLFVLRAQPVGNPRAQTWRGADAAARMEQQILRAVQGCLADDRADHAQLIRDVGDVRQEVAHPQARLPALFEFPEILQPFAIWGERLRTFIGPPLRLVAVPFGEFWFRIKGVHMRHAAVHEEKDDVLGARREMRERSPGLRRRPLIRESGERQHSEAHARALEKTAPRECWRFVSRAERVEGHLGSLRMFTGHR